MNRVLSIALVLTLTPSTLMAGNVFNSSNHSAEYIRTLNRNASTGVDAAVYNAAGTVALPEGFHLSITNQFVFKKDNPTVSHPDFPEQEYISDNPVLFYPTVSAVYASDAWSVFLHLGVPAGGGSKDFAGGHPALSPPSIVTLLNQEAAQNFGVEGLKIADVKNDDKSTEILSGNVLGSSTYLGVTLGGAYQLMDELAGTENRIAVARMRYNDVVRTYNRRVRTFPGSMFANSMGFEARTYFEIEESDRETPRVNFN